MTDLREDGWIEAQIEFYSDKNWQHYSNLANALTELQQRREADRQRFGKKEQ